MEKIAKIRFERRGDDLAASSADVLLQLVGREFVLSIGVSESLVIHTSQRWKEILDRIDSLPLRQQQMLHPLLVYSAKVHIRADGSWTLPRSLSDVARIEREAWLCIPEPSDYSALTQKSLILTAHCP